MTRGLESLYNMSSGQNIGTRDERFLRNRRGNRNLTIQQLIEEQRARIRSRNPAERLASALLIPGVLAKRLRLLGDPQLAQLLDDEVWSNLNLLAPESTICLAAADRLRGHMSTSPERKQFGIRRRARRSRTALRDEGVHLLHAEAALYRAGIPNLLLPFQKNRFASSTFFLKDVKQARTCLLQADFREVSRCATALIHSHTRQAIYLYEDRTRLYSANEEGLDG